jgi:hypothetical protein
VEITYEFGNGKQAKPIFSYRHSFIHKYFRDPRFQFQSGMLASAHSSQMDTSHEFIIECDSYSPSIPFTCQQTIIVGKEKTLGGI